MKDHFSALLLPIILPFPHGAYPLLLPIGFFANDHIFEWAQQLSYKPALHYGDNKRSEFERKKTRKIQNGRISYIVR